MVTAPQQTEVRRGLSCVHATVGHAQVVIALAQGHKRCDDGVTGGVAVRVGR
jgi:hypothetical protein